ncbi:MAG: glycosyl hydrolase-related protein, partial [Jiangellaceae bacterium]
DRPRHARDAVRGGARRRHRGRHRRGIRDQPAASARERRRSGDVVVRLYEGLGGRATGHLIPAFPVTAVTETDLLERPIEPAALTAAAPDRIELRLRPFQIVTLRLGRGQVASAGVA